MSFVPQTSAITVAALYIYPMKSCRGQALSHSVMDGRGFKHDRAFMLVHPNGDFVLRSRYPRIVLIDVFVEDTFLRLQAPGMNPLQIEFKLSGLPVEVTVWDSLCEAIDQGDRAADWFSTFLGTSCRLVRMTDTWQRPTTGHNQVSFVDSSPFLLTSESSLADLNSRLTEPAPMLRFRPNIVLSGTAPFAEDEWKRIRIGEHIFKTAEACRRCMMITIHPNMAVVSKEPLHTLTTYRRSPSGHALFGQYLTHSQLGTIHVGDSVEILE